MEIRKSKKEDINEILSIYSSARKYMAENNNPNQWKDGYPQKELIEFDIENRNSYVLIENNKIAGTFSFIIGEDKTYQKIINGAWNQNKLYGTIHRLASDGKVKGVAKACFDFCKSKIDYFRIDTHPNNLTMQNAISKYGFKKCGNIFVKDESIRIAYDFSN